MDMQRLVTGDELERLSGETEAEWDARTTAILIARANEADNALKAPERAELAYTPVPLAEKTQAMIEFENEFVRRNAIEASLAILDATDTSKCLNIEDVTKVILKYVRYIMDEQKRASRLFSLNRKFGMACKRFGFTTNEALRELIRVGDLRLEVIDDVMIYYDPVILSKHQDGLKTDERLKVRMEFINKAFVSQRKRR